MRFLHDARASFLYCVQCWCGIPCRGGGILKSTVFAVGILRDPVLNDNINSLEGTRIPATQCHCNHTSAKILRGEEAIQGSAALPTRRPLSTTPSDGFGPSRLLQTTLPRGGAFQASFNNSSPMALGLPPRQGPFNQPFRCNSVFWFWPAPAELWCRKVWLKGKLGPKHSVQRTLPHSYFSNSFNERAVFIEENGFAKSQEETGFKDTLDRGSAN